MASDDTRGRIVAAAAKLLEEGGRDAVTTRAVCDAAGIQAPTLYRQFDGMAALLEEVAQVGFEEYLQRKQAQPLTDDPVADLRAGWAAHVEFGLEMPGYYLLMYGRPEVGARRPTIEQSLERLRMLVERIAVAGLLSVDVALAVEMVHSAGVGVTLSLIQTPPERRDRAVADRLREAVLASITGSAPSGPATVAQRAASLSALLDDARTLYSPGERALLGELLTRAARS